jgi:ABC-type transport system involved in cytochrome bd biosynthesis fused ATPase/permease subunit
MATLLAKVALAAVLTVASAAGLMGLSGLIIFADLKAPTPAPVIDTKSAGSQPLAITGPNP